jgi:hypothetical protein
MGVNLMAGRIDGDDQNEDKSNSSSGNSGVSGNSNNAPKANTIDLTLEKPKTTAKSPSAKSESKPILSEPKVKEIKVKVPADISPNIPSSERSQGSLKIVMGIVGLLVVVAGVLLFMLNSESQNLKGSINEIPETNSTQIVDDILAEDFSNEVDDNANETETVDTSEQNNEIEESNSSSEIETDEGDQNNPETQSESTVVGGDSEDNANNNGELELIETEDSSAANTSGENGEVAIVLPNNDVVIDEYDIQSGSEVTTELIDNSGTESAETDFSQSANDPSTTVAEQVSDSEEIQGETGPALWLSVIIATLISFAYARKNDKQLG